MKTYTIICFYIKPATARLRNLLVHRYWVVDDSRVLKEARENSVETVREVLRNIRRLIEE